MLQNTPHRGHERCPTCGHPVAAIRAGVRLTPMLALIFDRVQLAGNDGIEGNELRRYLAEKTGKTTVLRALPVRVYALNDIIEDAGLRVKCRREFCAGGNRKGQQWIYYLETVKP